MYFCVHPLTNLNAIRYSTPPYEALKLLQAPMTNLKITAPGSCCKINLARLVECTGNLQELAVEEIGDSLDIEALPSLIDFPKLERFFVYLRIADKGRFKGIQSILHSRPSSLRELRIWWPYNKNDCFRNCVDYFGSGRLTWFVTPFGVQEHCQTI